jgi:hypothetical protein
LVTQKSCWAIVLLKERKEAMALKPFDNSRDLSLIEEKFLNLFVKEAPLRVFQVFNQEMNKHGLVFAIEKVNNKGLKDA